MIDKIAVFDLETTGVDVYEDRIVTAFVGLMDSDGNLHEKRSWLIYPEVEIPQGAIDVHGITNEKAHSQGEAAEVGVGTIIATLRDYQRQAYPVAGFNLAFDLTMLHYEALRYGLAPFVPTIVLDPFIWDKANDKYRKGKRTLTAVCQVYGIETPNAHDAEADCVAAGKLTYAMLDELGLPAGELHHRSVQWAAEQGASLQAYFRRTDPNAVVDGRWPLRLKEEKND